MGDQSACCCLHTDLLSIPNGCVETMFEQALFLNTNSLYLDCQLVKCYNTMA